MSGLSPPASSPKPAPRACRGRAGPGPASTDRLRVCPRRASRPAIRGVQAATAGGTVLTAPRVQSRAMGTSRGSTAVRTSGVFSSVRAISGCRPASAIISARPSARHSRSTTTDSRAPSPTSTTWPGAASIPVRSATAGGTDSAEKNDSWLTQSTVGQWRRTDVPPGREGAKTKAPALSVTGTARGFLGFL